MKGKTSARKVEEQKTSGRRLTHPRKRTRIASRSCNAHHRVTLTPSSASGSSSRPPRCNPLLSNYADIRGARLRGTRSAEISRVRQRSSNVSARHRPFTSILHPWKHVLVLARGHARFTVRVDGLRRVRDAFTFSDVSSITRRIRSQSPCLTILSLQQQREGASVQQATPAAAAAPRRRPGHDNAGVGVGVGVAPTRRHGPWQPGGDRDGEGPRDAGRPRATGRSTGDRSRRGGHRLHHRRHDDVHPWCYDRCIRRRCRRCSRSRSRRRCRRRQ